MHQESDNIFISKTTLGKGKFGTVVKGLWNKVPVAIKQLNKSSTIERASEIQREIDIHRDLKHPNIVALISTYEDSEGIYIILELMAGGSLDSIVHNRMVLLDESICESIIKDIVTGLDYLHDSGILHRDIKSSNILLNDQMQAKISDFGLSIKLSEANTCSFAGTRSRLAPELIKPPRLYSTKTDIYAFGILVSELVRRELPYKEFWKLSEDNWNQLILSGVRDEIPAGTPKILAAIITNCSVPNPDQRPSTKEILSMLTSTEQHQVKIDSSGVPRSQPLENIMVAKSTIKIVHFKSSRDQKQKSSDENNVLCSEAPHLLREREARLSHSYGVFSARHRELKDSSEEEETTVSICSCSCVIQ